MSINIDSRECHHPTAANRLAACASGPVAGRKGGYRRCDLGSYPQGRAALQTRWLRLKMAARGEGRPAGRLGFSSAPALDAGKRRLRPLERKSSRASTTTTMAPYSKPETSLKVSFTHVIASGRRSDSCFPSSHPPRRSLARRRSVASLWVFSSLPPRTSDPTDSTRPLELLSLSPPKEKEALDALAEVFISKRFKATPITALEPVIVRCVRALPFSRLEPTVASSWRAAV